MCGLQPFKIDLKGLKDDETRISFALDDSYFEAIDAPEVRKGDVAVDLFVRRAAESCFDDLVTVPEDDGVLDTTWFIYEFIALSIPIKHVHAPGKCNRDMIETLAEHSATRSSEGEADKPMDPRWSGLLKIKEPKD